MEARRTVIKDCILYQADAYETLADVSEVDAVITDPPYGVTNNDWDRELDFARFWPLAKCAAKSNAAFAIFCQMPFAGRLWQSNQKDFRYEYIYKKPTLTNFLNGKKNPLRAHELIYIFYSNFPKYAPQMKKGKPYKNCLNIRQKIIIRMMKRIRRSTVPATDIRPRSSTVYNMTKFFIRKANFADIRRKNPSPRCLFS